MGKGAHGTSTAPHGMAWSTVRESEEHDRRVYMNSLLTNLLVTSAFLVPLLHQQGWPGAQQHNANKATAPTPSVLPLLHPPASGTNCCCCSIRRPVWLCCVCLAACNAAVACYFNAGCPGLLLSAGQAAPSATAPRPQPPPPLVQARLQARLRPLRPPPIGAGTRGRSRRAERASRAARAWRKLQPLRPPWP